MVVNSVLIVTSENDKFFFFLSKRNMNPYLLLYDSNACVLIKVVDLGYSFFNRISQIMEPVDAVNFILVSLVTRLWNETFWKSLGQCLDWWFFGNWEMLRGSQSWKVRYYGSSPDFGRRYLTGWR